MTIMTYTNGEKRDELNVSACRNAVELTEACKRLFNGNGRLGVGWCGIDTDILLKSGAVWIDAWTKVVLAR